MLHTINFYNPLSTKLSACKTKESTGFTNLNPNRSIGLKTLNQDCVSFGATRASNGSNEKIVLYQTSFYRDDLDWDDFTNNLIQSYPEGAQIISHCGSDGSEALTLAIEIIKKIGIEEAQDFLPIKVFDYASTNVKRLEHGLIGLYPEDIKVLKDNLKGVCSIENLFEPVDKKELSSTLIKELGFNSEGKDYQIYRLNPLMHSLIEVKQGDITSDIANPENLGLVEDKPVVMMARNFGLYLSSKQQDNLASDMAELYDLLPPKSILVTGNLEANTSWMGLVTYFNDRLETQGFVPIKTYSSSKTLQDPKGKDYQTNNISRVYFNPNRST